MTHAYDRILLERAADSLGRMLDYSVYSLHYDIQSMMGLFIACGTAARFERGDIRTIAGMSGVELAYEVLEGSGLVFERTQPRYTKSLSPEYWCGYTLAHIQWETCLSFDRIMKNFSPAAFTSGYGKNRTAFLDKLPLNIGADERVEKVKEFGRHYAEETASKFVSEVNENPLKRMRLLNGLSQSGLARETGIPVRTIQQYEQGQKDLSKARAEYIIALSCALNCSPTSLLQR